MGTKTIVFEIDRNELAVAMCEASYGLKRPEGLTAEETLAAMDPEPRAIWIRAAQVAAEYFRKCVESASEQQ